MVKLEIGLITGTFYVGALELVKDVVQVIEGFNDVDWNQFMSSEMYSTNPSFISALFLGVPPWLITAYEAKFQAVSPTACWGLFGIGVFWVAMAIGISWGVGHRSIVMECPIIAGVGAIAGFIGWMRLGNVPLLWGSGIFFIVLVAITFYAARTKALH